MLISSLEEHYVPRRNTGGICSSSPETLPNDGRLQSRCVTSTDTSAAYCICIQNTACVCSRFLIRLRRVASVWMNSSSPQGHQSWVHPLSCSALCHPPCTPLELHFISVSLPEPVVFHFCGNKFAFKSKNAAGGSLKGLGGRQRKWKTA